MCSAAVKPSTKEHFRATDIPVLLKYNLPAGVNLTELKQKCITL